MKKATKNKPNTNKYQHREAVKTNLPIKNPTTDAIKNTASQTPGMNQANITRDDLFPSDGDNLTN